VFPQHNPLAIDHITRVKRNISCRNRNGNPCAGLIDCQDIKTAITFTLVIFVAIVISFSSLSSSSSSPVVKVQEKRGKAWKSVEKRKSETKTLSKNPHQRKKTQLHSTSLFEWKSINCTIGRVHVVWKSELIAQHDFKAKKHCEQQFNNSKNKN